MDFAIDIAGSEGDEVTSFVVLVPSVADFRSERALREVEAFLKGRFPGFNFMAGGETHFEGDYQVLPLCGVPGNEPGTLHLLERPAEALMQAINAALHGFRPRAALN